MSIIHDYNTHKLRNPIVIKPDHMRYFELFFYVVIAISISIIVFLFSPLYISAIGFLFIVLLGSVLLLSAKDYVYSIIGGVIIVYRDGIYITKFGYLFPWNDVRSAWLATTTAAGEEHVDFCIALRNSSYHRSRLGLMSRLSVYLLEYLSRYPGVISRILKSAIVIKSLSLLSAVTYLRKDDFDSLDSNLTRLQKESSYESDIFVLSVPLFFSAPDARNLVEIINLEVVTLQHS